MQTPVADFVRAYAASGVSRLHMPGHKGIGPLGCETFDITEVAGADELYQAAGIIGQSEANASSLFGSGRTVFSTEGSSQCIRAMLYLALTSRTAGAKPVVVAARNVHKAFVYAAALLDLEVVWLYPEGEARSLCACHMTADTVERTLRSLDVPPAAVYLTSPDYLGGQADIAAVAEVCHRNGTLLAVDNAHGAYLRFLPVSMHPLDLGADLCCDSAHKTLPVLTGGAYLHISRRAPAACRENAKNALALFGSTSPSYLILTSLDLCNRYLEEVYPALLTDCVKRMDTLRAGLTANRWRVEPTDPLRVTISAPEGGTGTQLANRLRAAKVECEYADRIFLVLMATPDNAQNDLDRVLSALGKNNAPPAISKPLPVAIGQQAMSIRDALFAPHETIPAEEGLGRVCASPMVSCPPAIPIAVSGEVIDFNRVELFRQYNVSTIDVVL